MKKYLVFVLAVLLIGALATGVLAAGPDGPSGKSNVGHLYMYEKDAAWVIVPGGARGKLKYNLAGCTFDFVFNGHGLVAEMNYTLIYYPDKAGNPWPRTDIICLGSGTANRGGNVHIKDSCDTVTGLPNTAVDINDGAKIWLVLSADVDCLTGIMSGWNPTDYLFENNLISHTDTG